MEISCWGASQYTWLPAPHTKTKRERPSQEEASSISGVVSSTIAIPTLTLSHISDPRGTRSMRAVGPNEVALIGWSAMPVGGGLIVGRYFLHDEIAAGGMATVHLGRMIGPAGFSRTLAIKRLRPHLARDPEFTSALLDEGRLAGRIQHASVASVLDVVSSDGELFLVMEYIAGESLARLLQATLSERKQVPVPVAVGIIASTLSGLHAAHEVRSAQGETLGLVHRDVSPQNILVGPDGVSRILDFGIAKAAFRLQTTRDGKLKGKLRYISPEQLLTGKVDRRADIYAASMVLWETLAGRPRFNKDDAGSLVNEILHAPVPPPSTFSPGLPPGLDDVVLRGLARDPGERFATAAEMIGALERIAPPATAHTIGNWVTSVAGPTLDRRAALVASIELESSARGRARVGFGNTAAELPASTTELPTATDAVAESAPIPSERADLGGRRRGRRALAWLAGATLFVAVLACTWVWTRRLGSGGTAAAPRPDAPSLNAPPLPPTSALPDPSISASDHPLSPANPAGAAAVDRPVRSSSRGVTKRPSPASHPSATTPTKNCVPPYVMDGDGNKRFRPECL